MAAGKSEKFGNFRSSFPEFSRWLPEQPQGPDPGRAETFYFKNTQLIIRKPEMNQPNNWIHIGNS